MSKLPNNLFVLEMANNHMGDIQHGVELIKAFGLVCRKYPHFKFAFKLQYRDLDTFIHPDLKDRMDIKYIKRFAATLLAKDCPIRVSTGNPAHKASLVVVWALQGKVSKNKSA